MPDFRVKGGFCLEIEDVKDGEEAKKTALDQLSDCFRYYPFETALDVKAEPLGEALAVKVLTATPREIALLNQCVTYAVANIDHLEEVTDEHIEQELNELLLKVS